MIVTSWSWNLQHKRQRPYTPGCPLCLGRAYLGGCGSGYGRPPHHGLWQQLFALQWQRCHTSGLTHFESARLCCHTACSSSSVWSGYRSRTASKSHQQPPTAQVRFEVWLSCALHFFLLVESPKVWMDLQLGQNKWIATFFVLVYLISGWSW